MKALLVICLLSTQVYLGLTQDGIDDLIKEIFNTKTDAETPDAPEICGPTQRCVQRITCENGAVNTNGENLIDIRIGPSEENKCDDFLSVCCNIDKLIPPPDFERQDHPACGIRNKEGVGFRIIGGHLEAEFGEFPWMIAVLSEESVADVILNRYECGGSLIAKDVVLTAAHCVKNKDRGNLVVRAGEWDTQTKNEAIGHQDRRVKEIIMHEGFNKGTLFNDVALLIIDEPFVYEENVRPTCLPNHNQNFDFERCYATGWGKDKFGKAGTYQVILKKIDLPIVPKQVCQANLRKTRLGAYYELNQSFVCAGGEEGKDTCKGDGGSPLVCPINEKADQYAQVGIVAYGVGCGTKDVPGVYADVAYLRPWIDSQLRSRNIDISEYIP